MGKLRNSWDRNCAVVEISTGIPGRMWTELWASSRFRTSRLCRLNSINKIWKESSSEFVVVLRVPTPGLIFIHLLVEIEYFLKPDLLTNHQLSPARLSQSCKNEVRQCERQSVIIIAPPLSLTWGWCSRWWELGGCQVTLCKWSVLHVSPLGYTPLSHNITQSLYFPSILKAASSRTGRHVPNKTRTSSRLWLFCWDFIKYCTGPNRSSTPHTLPQLCTKFVTFRLFSCCDRKSFLMKCNYFDKKLRPQLVTFAVAIQANITLFTFIHFRIYCKWSAEFHSNICSSQIPLIELLFFPGLETL